MYGEGDRKLSEIKIEVGTFPTKDEGLPTMGLMIQTPFPVDVKHEILSALKLQELVKKRIESDGEALDGGVELWLNEGGKNSIRLLHNNLKYLIKESEK